ncbi:MAG TPA: SDR family oxidoreductase [Acidimicrobiales bacterium]
MRAWRRSRSTRRTRQRGARTSTSTSTARCTAYGRCSRGCRTGGGAASCRSRRPRGAPASRSAWRSTGPARAASRASCALSQEVARDGVTVNALALGMMDTVTGGDDELVRRLARQVPVGRLGTPEDAGAAVVYLASDEAAWITGQTVTLDGGATTH